MPNTLKLTNALADETRYSIYQYIVKQVQSVNVQQIADQFGIHPNVARLHLTKLNESKLITSELLNNNKGGRPARIYSLADQPIYLSFPKQENHLLLEWLLELVETMGIEALEKAKNISYTSGHNSIHQSLLAEQSFDQKIELLSVAALSVGYIPNITNKDDKQIITFSIYNCPYKGQLSNHPHIICSIHESFLKGQFDALFPNNEFVQLESKQNHCSNCVYQIEVL
ncbi:helix-turn-helix transcriptional regulator [Psychrobacillus psychrodurans]|uniref:Helix-turn-helix domain-containing protein n=1 Tax=Psychrobacillus psychrodurans TaxID=126157 RepID=A0A9X3RBY8_9BACI|nr:helix-turn-helix domain-containing protein [Psychrobacillus psychrodurans]MCZ8534813.1 helix-turn-helix domain-containing protein [Psychrobacillus psychrodurans]